MAKTILIAVVDGFDPEYLGCCLASNPQELGEKGESYKAEAEERWDRDTTTSIFNYTRVSGGAPSKPVGKRHDRFHSTNAGLARGW
jgi:hypothetical protein